MSEAWKLSICPSCTGRISTWERIDERAQLKGWPARRWWYGKCCLALNARSSGQVRELTIERYRVARQACA